MTHDRLRLTLVCLALVLAGCNVEVPHVVVGDADDDPPIVVLENYSPAVVLAAHFRLGDGNVVNGFEVVEVPVGARVSLATGLDPETMSRRVVLMDGSCALWVSEDIPIGNGPEFDADHGRCRPAGPRAIRERPGPGRAGLRDLGLPGRGGRHRVLPLTQLAVDGRHGCSLLPAADAAGGDSRIDEARR